MAKAAYKMKLDNLFIQSALFNQKSTEKERKTRLKEALVKNQYPD